MGGGQRVARREVQRQAERRPFGDARHAVCLADAVAVLVAPAEPRQLLRRRLRRGERGRRGRVGRMIGRDEGRRRQERLPAQVAHQFRPIQAGGKRLAQAQIGQRRRPPVGGPEVDGQLDEGRVRAYVRPDEHLARLGQRGPASPFDLHRLRREEDVAASVAQERRPLLPVGGEVADHDLVELGRLRRVGIGAEAQPRLLPAFQEEGAAGERLPVAHDLPPVLIAVAMGGERGRQHRNRLGGEEAGQSDPAQRPRIDRFQADAALHQRLPVRRDALLLRQVVGEEDILRRQRLPIRPAQPLAQVELHLHLRQAHRRAVVGAHDAGRIDVGRAGGEAHHPRHERARFDRGQIGQQHRLPSIADPPREGRLRDQDEIGWKVGGERVQALHAFGAERQALSRSSPRSRRAALRISPPPAGAPPLPNPPPPWGGAAGAGDPRRSPVGRGRRGGAGYPLAR